MILCNDNQTLQKARELLGWEAKVNRAEGMKITYDFRSMSKEELSKEEHKDFSKYIS
jgi:dTDP-glucose 4,6-dehydratase